MSLKESVKERLLKEVLSTSKDVNISTNKQFRLLVLDKRATRVLNSSLSMYDITHQGVADVVSFEKNKSIFSSYETIFIIDPNESSIRQLCDDFAESQANYSAVYLYFLKKCNRAFIDTIKDCKFLISAVRIVSEVNIDFLTADEDSFHFDMELCLVSLFAQAELNDQAQSSLVEIKKAKSESLLGERLVTLCATLNEYPFIQFNSNNKVQKSLALLLQSEINSFIQNNSQFWWKGDGREDHGDDSSRGSLILYSRDEDVLSPLLVDLTYDSLIHSFLDVSDGVVRYEYDGKKHRFCLSEDDNLYQRLRYAHMSTVLEILNQVTQHLNTLNPQKKLETREVEDMIAVVQNLQEYGELKERHLHHLQLSQKLMEIIQKQSLIEINELQEAMICYNVDRYGILLKEKDVVSKCKKLIRQESISYFVKFCLLGVFFSTQKTATESIKNDLVLNALPSLPKEYVTALFNLTFLGVELKAKEKSAQSMFFKTTNEDVRREKKHAKLLPEGPVRRFRSNIAKLVEAELNNSSSDLEYVIQPPPSVIDKRSVAKTFVAGSETLSLRAQIVNNHANKTFNSTSSKEKVVLHQGSRLMVFVVGGITRNEMLDIQTLSKKFKRHVIVGGSSILQKDDFVFSLTHLDSNSNTLVENNFDERKKYQKNIVFEFDSAYDNIQEKDSKENLKLAENTALVNETIKKKKWKAKWLRCK